LRHIETQVKRLVELYSVEHCDIGLIMLYYELSRAFLVKHYNIGLEHITTTLRSRTHLVTN